MARAAAGAVVEPDCAEVGTLYVAVDHQRAGIGRSLLEALLAHYAAAGVTTLRIAVLTANAPARRFYEHMGGRLSGTRDHEEGPEVVYSWDLAAEVDRRRSPRQVSSRNERR